MKTNYEKEMLEKALSCYLTGFKDTVLNCLAEDKEYFGSNNPEFILTNENDQEVMNFILEDNYWLREWALYLFSQLLPK